MIKVIAISDTHGDLPKIEEVFDLLLVGGDIAPNFDHVRTYDREGQRFWFQNTFVQWVVSLPFSDENSKVVFIGGNHDFWLEEESGSFNTDGYSAIWPDVIIPCSNRLVYLYDQTYRFTKGGEYIDVYGTPWCKVFGRWAFMIPDNKLELAFNNIPENVDILLTHDAPAIPPYGFITEGNWAGEDAGNKPLAKAIMEKKPRWAVHGHIHSSPHEIGVVSHPDGTSTNIACVSYKNESYSPVYSPLVFEVDGHTVENKTTENSTDNDIQN